VSVLVTSKKLSQSDLPWRTITAAIAVGIPTVFAIAVYPFVSPYDTRVTNFFSYRFPGHNTPMSWYNTTRSLSSLPAQKYIVLTIQYLLQRVLLIHSWLVCSKIFYLKENFFSWNYQHLHIFRNFEKWGWRSTLSWTLPRLLHFGYNFKRAA